MHLKLRARRSDRAARRASLASATARAAWTACGVLGLVTPPSADISAAALWTAPRPCPTTEADTLACRRVRVQASQVWPDKAGVLELLLPQKGTDQIKPIWATLALACDPEHGWSGRLDDGEGHATFSVGPGGIAGLITTRDGVYRLRGTDPEDAIVELVPAAGMFAADSDAAEACRAAREPGSPVTCQDEGQVIDVQVAYTGRAREFLAQAKMPIEQAIGTATCRMQASFAEGRIRHKLRFLPVEEVAFGESLNTAADLDAILWHTQKSDAVHTLRRSRGADLLVLVVSSQQPSMACQFRGSDLGTTSFADRAFAVVTAQSLTRGDVLAHELGHLLGAGHADGQGGGAFGHSHGAYGRCPSPEGTAWRTIMVASGEGAAGQALPLWSSPRQTHCGQPVGDACTADNARTIDRTGCTVSRFQDPPP